MTTGQDIKLAVNTRETGKGASRRLRNTKYVPGVVYGSKTDTKEISAEEKWLVKYSRSEFENAIFTLQSEDKDLNNKKVLMKSIDVHPVSRRPVHVDFYAVDMLQEVRVNIELRFEGKAAGLQGGGILQPIRRNIEVDCLPDKIPDFIEVDVTDVELDQTLHLSDLKLPDGVKPTTTEDVGIVTVAQVKEEVVEVAPVVEEGAEGEAAEGAEGAEGAPAAAEGGKKEGGDAKAAGDKKG